ncbi:MAG TPA: GAF domain-containing protein [Fimbriimonadaceae bacterium]|nr:GAF domain-containing protein [Fimbriimonadaceae bacterium]
MAKTNVSMVAERIWHAALAARSEDSLMQELAQSLRLMAGAAECDLLLREGESLVLMASTFAPELAHRVRIGKGIGLCGTAMAQSRPILIEQGLTNHPQFRAYPGLDEGRSESAVILPLAHEGGTLGVAMLRRPTPWIADKGEINGLDEAARASALAIGLFRSACEIGARRSRLGAVTEVTRILTGSPYLEEILQLLVNITAQQFGYVVVTVRLLDEEHQELVLRATQSTVKAYQRKRAIRLGESIAGRAIAQKRTIVVPDVQREADYIGHDLAVEQGLHSMICVPLSIRDRPVGVMSCYTSEVREFAADEIHALETIANQAAISIEHAKLQVRHTLMQEMHHRVKNNLQQVVSLLRLQLRQSHYKSLEEALNDSLSRILAIASVHDLLSREDLDHVGIRSVAEALVQHQQQSFLPPGKQIAFVVRGDDVRLNMTQATQVALILNELLQNAVEHGYEAADTGDVHITVEDRDDEIGLWVSNCGDPLPAEFAAEEQGHLGLQIVANLSRALGGSFSLKDVLGWTVAEVKFSRLGAE